MFHLEIPENVPTPFIVATARPSEDPRAAAKARVRLPLAAELLATDLVELHTMPAGESGYADLMDDAAWLEPSERYLLDKARHHTVVLGHAPPVSQPGHAQAARAIARAVAETCDGVVYDGWSHQVMPYDFRFGAEHAEFCLADDWIAQFIGERSIVTAGMHRFALPELEAAGVPGENTLAAITLLRTLAVNMLAEHWDWLACHPGERIRPLSPLVFADSRDLWRYWASEPDGSVRGGVSVMLQPDPDQELPFLRVGPPDVFDASLATWWNDVVDLTMPYVSAMPPRMVA